MPKQAERLIAGVSADIRQMDANALAALRPAMVAARLEVEADLKAWMAKLGPNAADLKYTAAHLKQVQILLGVAQHTGQTPKRTSLPSIASRAVFDIMQQQQAPQRAMRTLVNQLEHLQATFTDMPQMQLLTASMLAKGDQMVIDQYKTSAARYAGNVRADLQHQFAVGLAKGEHIHQLVKRIANISTFQAAVDASNPAHAAKAMATGLTQRYDYWAQRLVRTELVNAYNITAVTGIRAAHKIDNRIKMMWDASNDLRICHTCKALHGKTAPVGGLFPGRYARPPAHPHCRCAVVTWMEEWDENSVSDVPPTDLDRERAKEAHRENERQRREERAKLREEQRARRTKRVEAPAGFEPGKKKVKEGLPRRGRDTTLYRVDPRAIADQLYALPDGSGSEARISSIKKAWSEGKKLQPVRLITTDDGKLMVGDGRHRLLVALEQGRDVLVTLDRGASSIGLVPLRLPVIRR